MADLKEIVARAIYDGLEGPVANQDFARQTRQWEEAQGLSEAVISALRDPPASVIEAGAKAMAYSQGFLPHQWHADDNGAEKLRERYRAHMLASWRAALDVKEW